MPISQKRWQCVNAPMNFASGVGKPSWKDKRRGRTELVLVAANRLFFEIIPRFRNHAFHRHRRNQHIHWFPCVSTASSLKEGTGWVNGRPKSAFGSTKLFETSLRRLLRRRSERLEISAN